MIARALRRLWKRRLRPLPSQAAYALWAATYPPQAHNPLMQLEQAAVLALLPPVDERSALDLAAGSGRYGRLLAEAGAHPVLALDNSLPMLAHNDAPWRALASMGALPLASATVDVIVCGMAVGHMPLLADVLAEIGRVLRPGGAAVLSDLHPVQHYLGAQRTFTAGNWVLAVEHYPHGYADYAAAAEGAGLRIDAVAEPRLKADGPPVVLVMRFMKGGST